MEKENQFKKGGIVEAETCVVLVTGKGDKSIKHYAVFAGVVIVGKKIWKIGEYSDCWATKDFNKVKVNLQKLISKELKLK